VFSEGRGKRSSVLRREEAGAAVPWKKKKQEKGRCFGVV